MSAADVDEVPPTLATTTSTVPAVPAGDNTVSEESLLTVKVSTLMAPK